MAGTENAKCGTGGAACKTCSGAQSCIDSVCTAPTAGCLDTCGGCCKGNVCNTGNTVEACGTEGDTCATCSGDEECVAGSCAAPNCGTLTCTNEQICLTNGAGVMFCAPMCLDNADCAGSGCCAEVGGYSGACLTGVTCATSPLVACSFANPCENLPEGTTNCSSDNYCYIECGDNVVCTFGQTCGTISSYGADVPACIPN